MDEIIVLIPIKSPRVFTKAPPLFPGFTAASVWMKDWIPLVPRSLALAETIPAVTVEVKLYGFPTARTHSPTFTESEFPNVVYGSVSSASIFSKAISIFESVPMSFALYDFLLFRVISISEASLITWLLVTI